MPYFKNENINLLFIHIPKTGGTTLEAYFNHKYKIKLDQSSLYLFLDNNLYPEIKVYSSLQHLTYNTIIKYKDFFKIDKNNLKILTVVRNPYERIVSDLFYYNKIVIDSNKNFVYNVMVKYLKDVNNNDNHTIPQFLFITDENHKLINNMNILHTESLNDDMVKLGYIDFPEFDKLLVNKFKVNYYDYLNKNSIDLINEYYDNDFKLFNYKKIQLLN